AAELVSGALDIHSRILRNSLLITIRKSTIHNTFTVVFRNMKRFVPLERDDPATIPEALTRAGWRYPTSVAIEHAAEQLSFRELELQCERFSRAFLAAGLRKGDRVAVWAPNGVEWIMAAIGAQAIGGVLVPINTRLKGKEAGFILRRSGARVLCTVSEFLGIRYPDLIAAEALPALEHVVDLTRVGTRNV